MNPAQLKKLAAAMAKIEEGAAEAGAVFSSIGSGDADPAGDAGAGKPARTRSRSKPAAAAEEVSEDTLREALKDLAGTHGKEAIAKALAVVGAGRLGEVDSEDYDKLNGAIEKIAKTKPKAGAKDDHDEVSYDDLEAKFKELVADDLAAAKAVLKGLKLKKLSDIDQDDQEALAEAMKAVEDAGEGDDSLV